MSGRRKLTKVHPSANCHLLESLLWVVEEESSVVMGAMKIAEEKFGDGSRVRDALVHFGADGFSDMIGDMDRVDTTMFCGVNIKTASKQFATTSRFTSHLLLLAWYI
jgi:hypothetical protein